MTNGEKYKTSLERAKAFCRENEITYDITNADELLNIGRLFAWLDLEAEEKPLPCPFCGDNTRVAKYGKKNEYEYNVVCECGYSTPFYNSAEDAIAAHDRVARAVAKAKESEASNG